MSAAHHRNPQSQRRQPKPLDSASLEEMALAYVARFATSAARFRAYLARKVRERGWAEEGEPPLDAIVARAVGAGYVDDEGYARSTSASLLRRGYGERRVAQALGAAGIAGEVRETVRADEGELRRAALTMARRRGFGPFGAQALDRPLREKQLAAMLRAGHPLDSARYVVNAASVAAAEEWADEAGDD